MDKIGICGAGLIGASWAIGFANAGFRCFVYDINQNSFFSNVVYNSIITNTQNKIKFGLNYTSDVYDEILNRRDVGRKDNSFGGFFEYSFDNFNNLNFVAGLRYDTHNNMGSFFTPRFHLRYTPLDLSLIHI